MLLRARSSYSALIRLARTCSATFAELMLTDEETGAPIEMTPFQEEWHTVANTGRNMVVWAHPESGKSQHFSIARQIHKLGRDPRRRHAILADTKNQSEKIISAVAEHIEHNPIVHEVFPRLRPGGKWTANELEIERPYGIKDPSLQAYGVGTGIQGARLDELILDDILVEDNTRTPYQREKLEKWVKRSAFSRLTKDAQIVFLANAWHPDDMAHEMERLGWWAKRYPVLDPSGRPTWPSRWPLDRVIDVRDNRYGPLEFARVMMCQPRDESSARFKKEWIERCMMRGRGYHLALSLEDLAAVDGEFAWLDSVRRMGAWPEGYFAVTGVDLAVSKKDSADLSVVFTILVWPDGTRQVLNIESGRWSGPEIVDRVIRAHFAYHSAVIVENNAAQDFIIQFARNDPRVQRVGGMPIFPFTTGRNKLNSEYGVESLGAEMAAGKWIIPSDLQTGKRSHPEVQAWIEEMYYYDPTSHTGDRLMAAWFAKEYARAVAARSGGRRRGGGARVIGG